MNSARINSNTPVESQLELLWDSLERMEGKVSVIEHGLATHKAESDRVLKEVTTELRLEMKEVESGVYEKLTSQPFWVALTLWIVLVSSSTQAVAKALGKL